MTVSKIEQEYWDALNRLKTGKTKYVDTQSIRFKFTKDSVGREAGRGKGYVRYERYPKLCDAIAEAEAYRLENNPISHSQSAKLEKEIQLKHKARDKYKQLKEDYDRLLADYINIMLRNFELETGSIDVDSTKIKIFPKRAE